MDQKVNPQRYRDAVEVANLFGLRVICMFNDHREKLIQSRAASISGTRRRRR
jgi:hypothetical protein